MVPEGWRPGAGCARSARGLWRRISPTGNNIGNEDQDLRIRSVKCHAAELNSQSFAPPGASAPRVASASQPAKLRRRASESAPDPQPEDLRAPPSAGASRDVRAPTCKVTATRQRIGPRPATRRLARSPQRRRFPGRPRPNPQSYGDAPANRPPPATRSLARSCERIDSGWKGFPPSQPEASARMPWATSPCSSFSLTLRVPSAYCGVSERNTSPTRQF